MRDPLPAVSCSRGRGSRYGSYTQQYRSLSGSMLIFNEVNSDLLSCLAWLQLRSLSTAFTHHRASIQSMATNS